MGYSIATPIKSAKEKAGMLRFLGKHWRRWDAISGRKGEGGHISDPTVNLAYDHGRGRIGFNFNAPEGERTYAWCMCAWIAIKIGRRMNHEGKQIPYFYYDGDERIRVIVGPSKTGDEKDRFDRYDELGVIHLGKHDLCYTNRREAYGLIVGTAMALLLRRMENEKKRDRKIIRKEIERLNALWAKENR